MSTEDVFPRRESIFVTWIANLATKVAATPTAFGATSGMATTLTGLNSSYQSSYATANDPATRTKLTVAQKDSDRQAVQQYARVVVRVIQAYPSLTNAQREDLGLKIPDGEISPINPPTVAPLMSVTSVVGRTIKVFLQNAEDPTKRAKPPGVQGATVLYFAGDEPPIDLAQWVFAGSVSRNTFDVEIDNSVPAGSKIWLTAFWTSPRLQSGPAVIPFSTYIAGGLEAAA